MFKGYLLVIFNRALQRSIDGHSVLVATLCWCHPLCPSIIVLLRDGGTKPFIEHQTFVMM